MIGEILVKVAFALCFLSVVSYLINHLRGTPAALTAGRLLFRLAGASFFGTAAFLLYLILTHQFQYTYVWSYSSRELSTPLLVSTFYAGQEGSFMLWTLYTILIGLVLIRYSRAMGYEAQVMSVYGFITFTLLLMLIAKNPFTLVWESFPGEVQAGFVPANGRGLNPLLQNYWMVIHPQVLFSGFASMAVPYSFAVAALMKRDYQQWIKPVTPWMAFGGLILGLGIMLGGFWAYETLGWGGYWGWDPVENSSFVPWLVCVAGIHTTLSQRKTGGFVRTNLIMAMLSFLMVLYSTFLTRSGVLGDTSVHSFVDPGMWVYWLLISLIVVFVAIAGGMLALRWKEIPWPKSHRQSTFAQFREYASSREFALFLGASTLFLLAMIVAFGTSTPIITDILDGKKSAIDISFYAKWSIPFAVIIGTLTGLAQLMWWTRSDRPSLLKVLRIPVLSALIGTAILFTLGVREFGVLLVIVAALFALVANGTVALRVFKGNPKFMGGAIAHIGLAIMLLGFVASSKFDEQRTVSLVQGTPVETMGYTLTYVGYRPVEKERYAFQVNVEREGRAYQVAPVMYFSSYNEGLMRNPDVLNLITHDFYLAPLSLEEKGGDSTATQHATFRVGESRKVGDLQLTFTGFDLPETHMASMSGGEIKIGARFSVARNGSAATQVVPAKHIKDGKVADVTDRYEDRYEFTITSLKPDAENRKNSTVEVAITDIIAAQATRSPDILVAEASVKPYINLVWAGLIVLLVGFGVTIVRRGQEASLKRQAAEEPA